MDCPNTLNEGPGRLRNRPSLAEELLGVYCHRTSRQLLPSYARRAYKTITTSRYYYESTTTAAFSLVVVMLAIILRPIPVRYRPIFFFSPGGPSYASSDAKIVGVKRVDESSYYSLGAQDLARKLKFSPPRMYAVIKALKIKESEAFYKEFKFGRAIHKRYSPKALDYLHRKIPQLDLERVWQENRPRRNSL